MSDINPFINWNLHNTNEVLSPEEAKALRDSCLDDSEKLIQYFSPKLEEHQATLERQVEAIEKIANEAKNQSISSSELADSAKIQADIALKKSKEADIKGWIAIIISLIALFIEIAVNYVEIINFIKLFI